MGEHKILMLKWWFLPAIFIFSLNTIVSGNEVKTADSKNILILFSLRPTAPAYIPILDGFRTRLNEEYGDNYNLYIEYLSTDLYPVGNFPKDKFTVYNDKYQNETLDLMICVGTNIIGIVKSNASPYLLNLPTVSMDFDFSDKGIVWEKTLNEKTVVFPIKINTLKSIDLALKLFPETSSIFFVFGNSYVDQNVYQITVEDTRAFENRININFITNATMDEIIKQLRNLPEHSLIFIPSFNFDKNMVPYFQSEVVRIARRLTQSPIFTYTAQGFGEGVLGGYLINFKKAGKTLGDASFKVLKGIDPGSVKTSENDYYEFLFDWRELQRFNLTNTQSIPQESTILFEEKNFLNEYWWLIGGGAVFILLQTLLILSLIRLIRKQRQMNQHIKETEKRFGELVNEDRILRMGQITASFSHELNQPLTAILSNAQAGIRFIDSGNSNPDLLKEILQNIVEDDKRTASILSSIRGMLKLEKRDKELTDLNIIVAEIVEIYRSRTTMARSKLVQNLPESPVFVLADRTQIQQVILNLLQNALQAIGLSKPHNKSIIITVTSDSDNAVVSVRDFGEGIPDPIFKKLFHPFVTSKKEGLGIGLAISRSIIEDHKGKIQAENKPDGGVEFSFNLKLHRNDN